MSERWRAETQRAGHAVALQMADDAAAELAFDQAAQQP